MFAFTARRGRVQVAFTDRRGGASPADLGPLNLAAEGADDPAAVGRNLGLVMEAFAGSADASAALLHQVHGARVVDVDAPPGPALPGTSHLERADAAVTSLPDVTLMVRAADCVPVLLADPERGLVGAVHAGRQGLVVGVVPAAVAALVARGAEALVAWVGPHICGRCYEVPAPMREEVGRTVPQAWSTTSWGTPSVDLGAGVRAQLDAAGAEVHEVGRCTREDPDLHSYRRDGARAGRLAGLVRVVP